MSPRSLVAFPDHYAGHLKVWRDAVTLIHVAHPGRPGRPQLSGLGDPAGPRQWFDNGATAWRLSLVKFLPVDGRELNHGVGVDLPARTDGGVLIRAWSHAGENIEHRITRCTSERLAELLVRYAQTIGLLPTGASA
ncbi:hypothetical protein [Micromonospora sp. NPDC004704]